MELMTSKNIIKRINGVPLSDGSGCEGSFEVPDSTGKRWVRYTKIHIPSRDIRKESLRTLAKSSP